MLEPLYCYKKYESMILRTLISRIPLESDHCTSHRSFIAYAQEVLPDLVNHNSSGKVYHVETVLVRHNVSR